MINRIIKEGYASYFELKSGEIEDVFYLLHLVQWHDHIKAIAEVQSQANR